MTDGDALVLCEGSYGDIHGKTAHGLVRFTQRYRIRGVIDSTHAGRDAGEALDGCHRDIPIVANLDEGMALPGTPVSHLVVGVATVGGVLPEHLRPVIRDALSRGLNVDSGLHQFLGDDNEFSRVAASSGARIRDVRRPPDRSQLHFSAGSLDEVESYRVAVLGTDCAIGKRTTAWLLVQALQKRGISTEMIGTGQTTWMQGVQFGVLLDSIVNDFVSGEIEHIVRSAWNEKHPRVIVVEGQGSLIHPVYPGGFEILGAARPHAVILQHAPGRKSLEGFPGQTVAPPERHIEVIRLITGTPTIAVTLSAEGLEGGELESVSREIKAATGLPVFQPLADNAETLAELVSRHLEAGS